MSWNPRTLTSYSDPAINDAIIVYHHADPDSSELRISAADFDPGKHYLVKDLRQGVAEPDPAADKSVVDPALPRKTPTRAGQMVQWARQGADQFPEPREATRVRKGFVFFEGSETGIPADECYVVEAEAD